MDKMKSLLIKDTTREERAYRSESLMGFLRHGMRILFRLRQPRRRADRVYLPAVYRWGEGNP